MVDEKYSVAMAETLHYLKGISQNDLNNIPKQFMKFLEDNSSKRHKCDFDYNKPLKELSLSNEARGLIAMICLNYWCETEEQKENFKRHLNENEIRYQEELRKKYNPNDIFKKKCFNDEILKDISSIKALKKVEKTNGIRKVINKIKIFLHIN